MNASKSNFNITSLCEYTHVDMNTVHSLSFICMVLYFGYMLVFCTNCHYTFVRVGTLYMVETLLLLGRFS